MLATIEQFYQRYSKRLLLLVLLTLPLLAFEAARIPTNNDIETWLPAESDLKIRYDHFRSDFGSEEIIMLGFDRELVDPRLISAMTTRLEDLPGIRQAWDSSRFREMMSDLHVPAEAISDRLIGMTESADGQYLAILAMLSEEGTRDRGAVVEDIRQELEYCQLAPEQYALAGGPVIFAELDRLGGPKNNRRFFLITLLLGFLLLMGILRDWKTSAATILLTLWAIQATTTGVKWFAGEMNFILGALPVMVMIFTLATAIHYLHYYDAIETNRQRIARGLHSAWKPCLFATLTTTIGLVSLGLSDIMPVRQFGYAASLGCVISMFTALFFMPAVVTVCGFTGFGNTSTLEGQRWLYRGIIRHRVAGVAIPLLAVAISGIALPQLKSRLEPLDFLPDTNKVLQDFDTVQRKLTTLDSVEIVVDFDGDERLFLDRLDTIREIEAIVAQHRWVRRTSSPASFFPTADQMPESTRDIGSLLKSAKAQSADSDYVACGQRFWRISARIEPEARERQPELIAELQQNLAAYPITLTGLSPLIKEAQYQIFDGFWSSFSSAFLIISIVMVIALRSLSTGLFAMIPNLSPLILVF
ncbi:MAG: MMPL family transporter, partial [Planctomycetaceae bacterium]|nr:MMPL family transporter [Planctomycetaceae bacterium]